MNIQDTWKKSALPLRLRFNLNFLEFFKCSTNSKSVICRKRNFLMLTLANFVFDLPRKVSRYTTLHSPLYTNFKKSKKIDILLSEICS